MLKKPNTARAVAQGIPVQTLQAPATPNIPPVNQMKSKGSTILYSLGVPGKLLMKVRNAINASKLSISFVSTRTPP